MSNLPKTLSAIILATALTTTAPVHALSLSPAFGAQEHDIRAASFYKRHKHRDHHAGNGERVDANDRVWRGKDGRYYCKKDNGTTGLLIGGAVGGVAGHEIAGGGDKLLGTVIGAGAGALIGREIDRSKARCR